MVNACGQKRSFQLTLLSNYDLKDIYNADDFGLLYHCLPNKTYQLKSEKWYGAWQQEILWAISYPCSSLERPRIHDASKTSSFYLVATEINETVEWEIVWRVAQRAGQEVCFGRKKSYFCDTQLPRSSHIDNLKAIKLYFLTPNTTSKTQPMDQGVIHSLNAKYRNNVVQKIIQSVEIKKTLPKISLLQRMHKLVSAWDALSMQTIVNCFWKSGLSTESQETAITEDGNPFPELQDETDDARSA